MKRTGGFGTYLVRVHIWPYCIDPNPLQVATLLSVCRFPEPVPTLNRKTEPRQHKNTPVCMFVCVNPDKYTHISVRRELAVFSETHKQRSANTHIFISNIRTSIHTYRHIHNIHTYIHTYLNLCILHFADAPSMTANDTGYGRDWPGTLRRLEDKPHLTVGNTNSAQACSSSRTRLQEHNQRLKFAAIFLALHDCNRRHTAFSPLLTVARNQVW